MNEEASHPLRFYGALLIILGYNGIAYLHSRHNSGAEEDNRGYSHLHSVLVRALYDSKKSLNLQAGRIRLEPGLSNNKKSDENARIVSVPAV